MRTYLTIMAALLLGINSLQGQDKCSASKTLSTPTNNSTSENTSPNLIREAFHQVYSNAKNPYQKEWRKDPDGTVFALYKIGNTLCHMVAQTSPDSTLGFTMRSCGWYDVDSTKEFRFGMNGDLIKGVLGSKVSGTGNPISYERVNSGPQIDPASNIPILETDGETNLERFKSTFK